MKHPASLFTFLHLQTRIGQGRAQMGWDSQPVSHRLVDNSAGGIIRDEVSVTGPGYTTMGSSASSGRGLICWPSSLSPGLQTVHIWPLQATPADRNQFVGLPYKVQPVIRNTPSPIPPYASCQPQVNQQCSLGCLSCPPIAPKLLLNPPSLASSRISQICVTELTLNSGCYLHTLELNSLVPTWL